MFGSSASSVRGVTRSKGNLPLGVAPWAALVLGLGTSAGMACGSSRELDPGAAADGSAAPDAGVRPQVSALVDAYIDAYRTRLAQCRPGPVDATTESDLRTDLLDAFQAPGVSDAALDVFAQCVAQLAQAGCGAEPEACAGDIAGRLPSASPCLVDAQCASARCVGPQIQQCGQCENALRAGDDCSQSLVCGLGLLCVSDAAGAHCEAKSVVSQGAACSASANCAAGLHCNTQLRPAICESLVPPGGNCDGGHACDLAGTYQCDAAKRCSPRPTLDAACSAGECAAGFMCDSTTQRCRAPRLALPVQSPCELGDACAAGLGCSRRTSATEVRRCVPLVPLGADCSVGRCEPGLVCAGLGSAEARCVQPATATSCHS